MIATGLAASAANNVQPSANSDLLRKRDKNRNTKAFLRRCGWQLDLGSCSFLPKPRQAYSYFPTAWRNFSIIDIEESGFPSALFPVHLHISSEDTSSRIALSKSSRPSRSRPSDRSFRMTSTSRLKSSGSAPYRAKAFKLPLKHSRQSQAIPLVAEQQRRGPPWPCCTLKLCLVFCPLCLTACSMRSSI